MESLDERLSVREKDSFVLMRPGSLQNQRSHNKYHKYNNISAGGDHETQCCLRFDHLDRRTARTQKK